MDIHLTNAYCIHVKSQAFSQILERYLKHFDDTTGEQRKPGISIELSYLLEAAHKAICITRVKAQASTFSDKLMVLLKSRTKGEWTKTTFHDD